MSRPLKEPDGLQTPADLMFWQLTVNSNTEFQRIKTGAGNLKWADPELEDYLQRLDRALRRLRRKVSAVGEARMTGTNADVEKAVVAWYWEHGKVSRGLVTGMKKFYEASERQAAE